jgi:hypothetical protein
MLPDQRHEKIAEGVVSDRPHALHLDAELGEVDARARRRARGGGADLFQKEGVLTGRNRRDGPAEDVEDVRPHAHDRAETPRAPGA